MSSGFREMRKWTLWRSKPPPKRKKYIVHGIGAGNVGSPATRDSFAGRSGRAGLKKGEVVAVGEQPPQKEKNSHGKNGETDCRH
jgi:hypothetical protein